MKKIAIIGSGFSGLSAAAYAAKAGNDVSVFEKHTVAGGRARQFTTPEGFVFDMGPSWYWMPDIIEGFFCDFGFKTSDFFKLVSLNPQFEIIFSNDCLQVPESFEQLKVIFDKIEPGAAKNLEKFMRVAQSKYEIAMKDFVTKPCHNWFEFTSLQIGIQAFKLDMLTNFRTYVHKYFQNEKLRALMEFPVIFLGASPKNIPALYSLMNYGGYKLGTYYPIGGFYQLVLAMQSIAEKQGTKFYFNQTVEKINVINNKVTSLLINGKLHEFDVVISSCDYHHTESLLDKDFRNYTENYWSKKTFAPSCLIFYLGLDQKLPILQHHTLFFENDFDTHIECIYTDKKWPEDPLFYCCCPSKTDDSVAPKGKENIFLLMPIAIGLEDNEEVRNNYLSKMLARIEQHTGIQNLSSKIVYKRSYCVSDFIADYNAYGGNAYGLANTLRQTAILKPKLKNQKLKNLFYTGQLTVPGPGVPPCIISGKIVANQINNFNK